MCASSCSQVLLHILGGCAHGPLPHKRQQAAALGSITKCAQCVWQRRDCAGVLAPGKWGLNVAEPLDLALALQGCLQVIHMAQD